MAQADEATLARFMDKVEVDDESGCWNWTGALDPSGYGAFKFNKKKEGAHRAAWMLFFGSIPESHDVCHHCDNPRCVNPKHLFTGTRSANMRDAIRKGRPINRFKRGSRNPHPKLTVEQVHLIREAYDKRVLSARQLGQLFGVGRSAISKIVYRVNWKHVD